MKETKNTFTIDISEYRTSIMGVSMLSIMLFHQYFTSLCPFNIFHNYGFWGVDIFLFLSGMGLVNSIEKNSLLTYYKHRYIRLVPSCLLCGITKYLIFIFLESSLFVLKDGLNLGIWSIASLDLWFIHTIIIFYIIAPFLYGIIRRKPKIASFTIIVVFLLNGLFLSPIVGYKWMSLQGVISWSIERLPVFAAGMIMSTNIINIHHIKSTSVIFLIIAVALNSLEKTRFIFQGIKSFQILSLAMGMPAIIQLCIFILKKTPIHIKQLFIFLGTHSLELYLTHEFIFWSIKISFEDSNPIILLPISFILSCFAAYLCKLCTNKLTKI